MRRFGFPKLYFTLCIALSGWLHSAWALDTQPYLATVTHVADGDTIWVRHPDTGRRIKVRIQGIDAPEVCQAYGNTSKQLLSQKLMKRRVWVHPNRWDDYGRVLADVKLPTDGESGSAKPSAAHQATSSATQDIGAWMVRQGAAWSYRFRFNPGPYAAEQSEAQTAERGLFADAAAMEPKQFRQTHGPCDTPRRASQPSRIPF